MPNYTLYYFNGRGRAEVCRMLFAAGGVQYVDKRIEFSDWERCKNEFPCMYLPCLDIDDKEKTPEMMSIGRMLAREFGFFPKSNMDMFRCDYICDCLYEMFDDYMRYYHWKNGRFRFGREGMMMENMMESGGNMMQGSGGMMQSGGNMMQGSGDMMSGSGNMMQGSGGMMQSGGNMMQGSGDMMSGSGNMMQGSGGMMQSGGNMMQGSGDMMQSGGNMCSEMQNSGNMMQGSGGMMQSGGDMMGCNPESYMQYRYMNSFNRIMPFLEKTLCMKNNGSQFFMGEQIMWCDMLCYCFMETFMMENKSMFSKYPKMMSMYSRVASHQKISSYLKSRRNTNW